MGPQHPLDASLLTGDEIVSLSRSWAEAPKGFCLSTDQTGRGVHSHRKLPLTCLGEKEHGRANSFSIRDTPVCFL